MSDDLGGRAEVPQRVANRVTAEAALWAAQGFTDATVRPWLDLPPEAAGYLAHRGVQPRVLELPIDIPRAATPVALKLAIASGLIPVARAYDLLVATGEHREPAAEQARPAPGGPGRATPGADPDAAGAARPAPSAASDPAKSRRPVTPVIFSHAEDHSLPSTGVRDTGEDTGPGAAS